MTSRLRLASLLTALMTAADNNNLKIKCHFSSCDIQNFKNNFCFPILFPHKSSTIQPEYVQNICLEI